MAVIVALAFVASVAVLPCFAADKKTQEGIVDVGNKICPLMDGKVDGKTFAIYKGKRYNFCCPGCDKEFLKDPEKYIAKIHATEKDLKN